MKKLYCAVCGRERSNKDNKNTKASVCMSCSQKLRWQNIEYRKFMSEAHKGKIPANLKDLINYQKSEEGRKTVSNRMKGKRAWNKGLKKYKTPEEIVAYKKKVSWAKNKRNRTKRSNGGQHTYKEWLDLKKEYNYRCACCYKHDDESPLTEDHIIPISLGGTDDIINIQPLCRSCNVKKMTKIIKFRKK